MALKGSISLNHGASGLVAAWSMTTPRPEGITGRNDYQNLETEEAECRLPGRICDPAHREEAQGINIPCPQSPANWLNPTGSQRPQENGGAS